ncbi:MAG: hypothetical protein AAF937_05750 [Planctomycetota bacterium]
MIRAALVIAVAGSAAAQDTLFSIQQTTEPDRYVVSAEFVGQLAAGVTRLDVAWSDVALQISGDAPISFDAWNPGYENVLDGGVRRADVGVNPAVFDATMLGTPAFNAFGGPMPDSSNPLRVVTFRYAGDPTALTAALVGQNSMVSDGDPAHPFGLPEFFQFSDGSAGSRTFEFNFLLGQFPAEDLRFFVPAPSAMLAAPAACILLRRRRVTG